MLLPVFALVVLIAGLLGMSRRSVSIDARWAQLRFRMYGILASFAVIFVAGMLVDVSAPIGFTVSVLALAVLFYGNKRGLEVMGGLNPDYPLYDDC